MKLIRYNGKEYTLAATIYSPESEYRGDLAIVVLKHALPRSENIDPMPINGSAVACGEDVVVYGYGFSDTRHSTFFGYLATRWDQLTSVNYQFLRTKIIERNCFKEDYLITQTSTGTACFVRKLFKN